MATDPTFDTSQLDQVINDTYKSIINNIEKYGQILSQSSPSDTDTIAANKFNKSLNESYDNLLIDYNVTKFQNDVTTAFNTVNKAIKDPGNRKNLALSTFETIMHCIPIIGNIIAVISHGCRIKMGMN